VIDCVLIADDLTGACDAAVHFAVRGRRTIVSVGLAAAADDAAIVAVSTGSRELPPDQLRRIMAEAAGRLPVGRAGILFKKIDSTMRGNVGAEVAAALDALACDAAVVTPAFPAMKRVVEAGYLLVRGTEAFAPVEVARRLRWQGAEPCSHITPGAVAEALVSGARFLSVDALCDEDLDAIVMEGLASGRRLLWAGSGGLASALARTLDPGEYQPPPPRLAVDRVLFCLGSDHPATLGQQETLVAARPEHTVLRVPRGALDPDTLARLIAENAPGAFVLSGGDTATSVCQTIGARRIEVHREILPGIPLGVLEGGPFDGSPVATKAGGFGEPDALVRVADFLTGRNHG
jgi:D-threonate/D-erythronate kinase